MSSSVAAAEGAAAATTAAAESGPDESAPSAVPASSSSSSASSSSETEQPRVGGEEGSQHGSAERHQAAQGRGGQGGRGAWHGGNKGELGGGAGSGSGAGAAGWGAAGGAARDSDGLRPQARPAPPPRLSFTLQNEVTSCQQVGVGRGAGGGAGHVLAMAALCGLESCVHCAGAADISSPRLRIPLASPPACPPACLPARPPAAVPAQLHCGPDLPPRRRPADAGRCRRPRASLHRSAAHHHRRCGGGVGPPPCVLSACQLPLPACRASDVVTHFLLPPELPPLRPPTHHADPQQPDAAVKSDLERFLWNFLAAATAGNFSTSSTGSGSTSSSGRSGGVAGAPQRCQAMNATACPAGFVCVGSRGIPGWVACARFRSCIAATSSFPLSAPPLLDPPLQPDLPPPSSAPCTLHAGHGARATACGPPPDTCPPTARRWPSPAATAPRRCTSSAGSSPTRRGPGACMHAFPCYHLLLTLPFCLPGVVGAAREPLQTLLRQQATISACICLRLAQPPALARPPPARSLPPPAGSGSTAGRPTLCGQSPTGPRGSPA